MKPLMTGNNEFDLSQLKGMRTILYFYPKDNTPGCTREGEDFCKHYRKFQKANIQIFGVSRDSLSSHEKFKEKMKFPFELISDPNEELCKKFDVIKMKNMYGKKVRGIERSTFLLNEKVKIEKEWRKVRVDGHVDEILEYICEIRAHK